MSVCADCQAGTEVTLMEHGKPMFMEDSSSNFDGLVPRAASTVLGASLAKEEHLSVESLNVVRVSHPQNLTVRELFEVQAQRTPEAVALVAGDLVVTYAELDRRANKLALYLRNNAVDTEQLVGICISRSVKMIVGLLAIIKAGGAYLPLDPAYPAARLRYLLDDAKPGLVLTEDKLSDVLLPCRSTVISVDNLAEDMEGCLESGVAENKVNLSPKNLIYVIYTSGSTGKPKGIAMPHEAVVNLLEWHRLNYEHVRGRRVLQFAALSFDVAFQETFSTLCTGGTLILLNEEVRRDARTLLEFLVEQAIETLYLPPVMLQGLAEAFRNSPATVPRSLLDVIAAGEQLRISAVISAFFLRLPDCRLQNHYGPTETHVVTAQTLSDDPGRWPSLPSIGRPIFNAQIYILDDHYRLVPSGEEGEIYIGGAAVARGYLGRPDLTAQRFIPDPFGSDGNGRLYGTGDLARRQEDGTLEYLGRNDEQIKIRGFRIEPGEIEAKLLEHEEVKEAVVVARGDGVADIRRLVAYVTLRDPTAIAVDRLKAHLKAGLPDHMVPSVISVLEHFPLTPSGKLDRRILPSLESRSAVAREGADAPQSEAEKVIADIWRTLLGIERIARGDNFFELGGHSLLIVQMLERLRAIGLTLSVDSIYETPTVASLAGLLERDVGESVDVSPGRIPAKCDQITPSMLPLLELEPGHIQEIVRMVPGGAHNIQDIYPLAPLQEGIFFHYLLASNRGDVYARSLLLSLSSREKAYELVSALQATIDRHDILRTAVLFANLPQPVQVVQRRAVLDVEEVFLDPLRDPIEQLKERMQPGTQHFNIQRAPLVRLELAAGQRGPEWFALLRTHHLVCDNESLDILLSELAEQLEGRGGELPEPVPYRNHVAHALAHDRRSDSKTFFREKLAGIDEPTFAFGVLERRDYEYVVGEATHTIDQETARRIRTCARRLGITAASLFHAVWALVISRASGRDDIVFGSVLLGRLQGSAGAQRALGMFINTLPIRLRLQGVTTQGLVERVHKELAELLRHEQASLAQAQRCSGVAGNTPLFGTLLNYRHGTPAIDAMSSGRLGVTLLKSHGGTNYPLVLSVIDRHEGFDLEMETDRRVNPERMIGFVTTAIQSLIKALEKEPYKPALSLSILPEYEQQQVIRLFNPAVTSFLGEKLVHQSFEEQVERTPDALALVYQRSTLTYAELNARANQLARYLRDKGVGSDKLVGICVERSLEMVVGLLGILKAGGAYVPLDPSYPHDRLAYMLEDSALSLLLTQDYLRTSLPHTTAAVIALDRDVEDIRRRSTSNLDAGAVGVRSDQLAYVIYTSGSTGKPKGVMVNHANVNRLFAVTRGYFHFNQQDVWTLFHSVAFDFSVWELWGALLYGGRVVVIPHLTARSAQDFYRLLCSEGVTVLNQTPSAFAQLIDAQAQSVGRQHALRLVIFGGEALELRTLRPWVARNGGDTPKLVNMYGITETTVHVTCRKLTAEEIESEGSSPIGLPISDLRAYLLDRYSQPVPIGVAGELYIGGGGVARGYLNHPDLTAQRFLADPFSDDPGARLYRTGDLGRWRTDGSLEYLGRNDHQVKIRGFRIELGEIEAQLVGHRQVKDAVVYAREDVPGEKRLVAYVIAQTASGTTYPPSPTTLRTHLEAILPGYMVPSAFVVLDQFPLTASGKLDRSALPAPEFAAYATEQYEEPEHHVEKATAQIWQKLLQVDRVGLRDSFFALGGHSLLALKLLSKVNEAFGCSLNVTDIYRNPTVQKLATRIRGCTNADEFLDLSKEAALDEDIRPRELLVQAGPARQILLTGGTGFVGRFLLAQLLLDTDATIYCLVRARSQEHAASRLKTTLLRWSLWREEFESRVVAVPGDLSKARLGASEISYQFLCKTIDSIFHCATSMNHLESYSMAKPTNVEATKELVRLAANSKLKLINYISTLSIFSPATPGAKRTVTENTSIRAERHLTSEGYVASKWVGEGIMQVALERGIPCNVFRLGLIWADSQQGRYDELQREYRILKSCLLSGLGIRDYQYPMTPTPVDYAARAVVALASRYQTGQGVFHVSSPAQSIKGIFERCNQVAGTSLELVSYYEWVCRIRRLYCEGRVLPALPLVGPLFSFDEQSFHEYEYRRQSERANIDCTQTYKELEYAGITAPEMDDQLLKLCLHCMYGSDQELHQQSEGQYRPLGVRYG